MMIMMTAARLEVFKAMKIQVADFWLVEAY
jgi:hypothetical protein